MIKSFGGRVGAAMKKKINPVQKKKYFIIVNKKNQHHNVKQKMK